MTAKKTKNKVRRKEESTPQTFQLVGTVSIERIKEIFQKDEQVEFKVVARHQDRNVTFDLLQAGRK